MTKISQGSTGDTRRLILIRHAHRDNSVRERDNGLSEEGKTQAAALAKHFSALASGYEVILESSPKARCRETLAPLAELLRLKVDIQSLLDEQLPQESSSAFKSRIKKYLETWRETSAPLTVACSHGDWIPAALKETTGLHLELGKSGWVILRHNSKEAWAIEETVLQIGN